MCRSAYALCALHSVGCTLSSKGPGFGAYYQPLLRVDTPVRARVHAAYVKKWWLRNKGVPVIKRRTHTMRRTALLLAVMAAALVVASGVALAKNYLGTDKGEKIVGTKYADTINAKGGEDVLRGLAGADTKRGGNDKDNQYGGGGDELIFTQGGFRDLGNCGEGIDTAYVDSKERVGGCEKVR